MKRYTHAGFIVSLFFAATLLIVACILLFSYTGCSPKDGSEENATDKSSATSESALFFDILIKSTK